MAKPRPYIGCSVKHLPDHRVVEAAHNAVRINPTNHPRLAGLVSLVTRLRPEAEDALHPEYLAVMTTKYWGPAGVKLSVSFLDTVSQELSRKILSHMNAWGDYCNVKFLRATRDGDVRIDLSETGQYASYIGTDVKLVPAGEPTMWLSGFSLKTPASEYRRVVRHETGHCLAASTLIDCPRDLKKYPLGVPISEMVGREPWVYAWKDGQIVVRKASRVWRSKRNVPTVRVRLRTGKGYHKGTYLPPLELVGTPDHPVLLADGKTWRNLGDLKAGDRLCSLYRSKSSETRSKLTWTGRGSAREIREHAFVAEGVYGPRPDDCCCHHVDENQLNQSPDNLEWKNKSKHAKDHGTGREMPPDSVARRAAAYRGYKHTEEAKAKMRVARLGKKLSDETKAKMSASTKGRKQSPELAEKRADAVRRYYANGGRSGMLGKTTSEETRRKQSEARKAYFARERQANHVVVSVEPWLSQDVYDMTVPDADSFVANGVVVHNSLGFPHEHFRKQIIERLDPEKTVPYMEATQGWDAKTVRQQVLTPLSEASIRGTPDADDTSIMCYSLPAEITKDGRPIPGGTDINATDKKFAATVYPKRLL